MYTLLIRVKKNAYNSALIPLLVSFYPFSLGKIFLKEVLPILKNTFFVFFEETEERSQRVVLPDEPGILCDGK